MKNRFTTRWMTFLVCLLLISLACNTITGRPAAGSTPQVTTLQRDVAYGSGPFVLPDAAAGLADLSGYKATLTISFDGSRDGQPEKWSKTYVMLASKEPAASQLTIDTAGNASDLTPVFMVEMDGMDYEKRGEQTCSSTPIKPGNSLSDRLEPAGLLSFVVGADEAGSETVNEIDSNHYTFDQRALGQQDITESAGEVWVAAQGGYVVKYMLTSKGKADYFGEGIEGTISFDYELTEVNKPVEIKLPDDCPPGLVDAPLLPDAGNVENNSGMLSYDTAATFTDAAAFYQEQIPDLGWKPQGDPTVTDTSALLSYTKDGGNMHVIITTGDSGTQVRIVVSGPSPSQ